MAFQRGVAQFSSVEEGPHSFPLQTTGREVRALGLFFWKIHLGGTLSPSLGMEHLFTHGRAPFWRLHGGVQVGIAAVDAVILMDVIHFNRTVQAGELVGRGCFPACTVPQPTLARPTLVYMLHVLMDFWSVRSGKNFFFLNHAPMFSKPRAIGFILVDKEGQSQLQSGQGLCSTECSITETYKPWSAQTRTDCGEHRDPGHCVL